MSSKPLLGYWNYRGYGNPIKYLLEYMGVDYDVKTYEQIVDGDSVNRDSWFKEKFNLGFDFPNLPYLIDGNIKLTESRAIIKYLARRYDPSNEFSSALRAETEFQIQQMDVLDGRLEDMVETLAAYCYHNCTDSFKKLVEERLGHLIEQFSKFLGNKNWFMGSCIKYIDFRLYEYLHFMRVFNPEAFSAYPNIVQFLERFESLPAIKKYMESDKFISTPCFGFNAQYKM